MLTLDLRELPVYYINVNSEIEKKLHMEKMLSELGFKDVNRVEAILDYNDGSASRRGSSESYYKAVNNTNKPFILLEDDCEIFNFNPIINIPDNSDAIYLGNSGYALKQSYSGYFLKYKKQENFDNLYKVYNMLCTHAILYISERFINSVRLCCEYSIFEVDVAQDVTMVEMQKFYNVYTYDEPMFYQKYYGSGLNRELVTKSKLTDYPIHEDIFKNEHWFVNSL